jgi:hypothetical protein
MQRGLDFVDIENNVKVAVGPMNGRSLVVVYRIVDAEVKVIMVYHTRKLEKLISSKTKRGAWRKHSESSLRQGAGRPLLGF